MRLGVVPLVVAAMAAIVGLSTPALARSAGENMTVEQLLTSGWQVVGFASAAGSRAAWCSSGTPLKRISYNASRAMTSRERRGCS